MNTFHAYKNGVYQGQWTGTPEQYPDVTFGPEPTEADLVNALPAEQVASGIRAERNALLAQTDWTQISDAPVDQQKWASYRQSLRDITDQSGFPRNVTWPTKPE